eukprot:COSAG01_NODE_70241_length_259_cov_0.643750_1_plen_74_part_10
MSAAVLISVFLGCGNHRELHVYFSTNSRRSTPAAPSRRRPPRAAAASRQGSRARMNSGRHDARGSASTPRPLKA